MGRRLAFVVLPWVVACGDGPTEATNLTLEPGELTLELGFERQFRVVRADGPDSNSLSAVWTSSDTTVATIDEEGVATATGPGVAVITAEVSEHGRASLSAEVTVPPLVFASVSAGSSSTCGVAEEGTAYCWGNNRRGQLGDGGEHRLIPVPVPVADSPKFRQISVGWSHTCGISVDESSYCWGWGLDGRLGDGTEVDRPTPRRVDGGPFESIHAGAQNTCGLRAVGEAFCWGENRWGSVGDGTNVDRNVPTPLAGGLTFTELSAGLLHACGLTEDGTAHCWGRNDFGELGDGTLTDRSTPVPVGGDLRFRSISAGAHTCSVSTDNRAYCWGGNSVGQLGDGTEEDRLTPTPVETDVEFEVVLAGVSQTCGLSTEGSAYCWGWNFTGSLGQPPEEVPESWVPVPVTGDHVFHGITHTSGHTCGLATDGIVYCWGSNPWGELGIGVQSVGSYEPVPVFGQR